MNYKWSIGLMTGTVNDGFIDVAALKTDGHQIIEYGPFELIPYQNKNIQSKIIETFDAAKKWRFDNIEPAIFAETEKLISVEQSEAVNKFMHKFNFKRDDISCVGFHGLTVLHQAPLGDVEGKTKQLGDGNLMANYLEIPVVNDFRSNDILNGGQGAPLAPIYHLAVSHFINKKNIIILNIGGVSNITYIGEDDKLIAFDTGPGNAPINDFVRKKNSGQMDTNGDFASKGSVNFDFINSFLSHPYFELNFPKSLDRDQFSYDQIDEMSLEDGCATLTKLIGENISKAIKLLPKKPECIIASGGGRKNLSIMKAISESTNIKCESIEKYGLRGDAIEAEAFAFLAVRSLKKLPLSFPSTTGVTNPLTGGKIN